MGIEITPPGPAIASGGAGASLFNHGSVTSPTASQVITTIAAASLVTGTQYLIDAYVYADGTLSPTTDDDNMKIVFNGATVLTMPMNANSVNNGPIKYTVPVTAPFNGANPCQIQAVAIATTGAVYHASCVKTPLGA